MRNPRPRPYRHGYRVTPELGNTSVKVVLRRPDKSIWSSTKKFINSFKMNDSFKRKDLLKDLYRTKMDPFETIVDLYLYQLHQIGIIEQTPTNLFIKRRNIPKTLTTTQLRKLASNNWESWFTPIEMLDKLI